jgi:hypothetical protein
VAEAVKKEVSLSIVKRNRDSRIGTPMSSLYETKYDVIYRKLQERKLNLKKQFDEAYSRDDFQASMAVMEDIQKVMGSLSSLEILEKPFKETARVASRVEDIRVDLEILLESLGKEIRTLDGLQEILNKDLNSQMSVLLKMFREEDGKNFEFDFDKFSSSELMALMQYEAIYFPSRKEEFEAYTESVKKSEQVQAIPFSESDWSQPLAVVAGVGLSGLCVLEKEETQESVAEEVEEEIEDVPFDHGVEDLSEFGRQNDIPVLTDSETATILAQTEDEPEEISDIAFSEPEAITSEDVIAYQREVEAHPEMTEEELQQDLQSEIQQDSMEVVAETTYAAEEEYSDAAYAEEEYAADETTQEYAEADAAYAEEEYSQEAYPEDAYAVEAYPEDAYAEEASYAPDAYSEAGYAQEAYTEEAYSEEVYAEDAYSEESAYQEVATQDYESAEYPEAEEYVADSEYAAEAEYVAEAEYSSEEAYVAEDVYTEELAYPEDMEYAAESEFTTDMDYPVEETIQVEDVIEADGLTLDEVALSDEISEEVSLEDSVSLDVDALSLDISDSIQIGEEPVLMQELEVTDLDIDLNAEPTVSVKHPEPLPTETLDIDDIQIDLDNLD